MNKKKSRLLFAELGNDGGAGWNSGIIKNTLKIP